MARDVFVKASIINQAWSIGQIFLTPHGGSHFDLVAPIEECLINTCKQMLLGRFLAMTSTKTSLPKTMR